MPEYSLPYLLQELGSQPLPTTTSDDIETTIPRPRSGTWGSKNDHKEANKDKDRRKSKDKSKQEAKSKNEIKAEAKQQQKDKKKDKGSRSGSASRSNSAERRKSGDELQSPKKPGMLDVLRGRSGSDASKKKGLALMMTMFVSTHSLILHQHSQIFIVNYLIFYSP